MTADQTDNTRQYFAPLKVFLSYSHKDRKLFMQLKEHLAPLEREGLIRTWTDRELLAGSNFDRDIAAEIETADAILLLVSASFIASDYCYCVEMAAAIRRHADNSAKVIPIILKPCDWHGTPFGKLLALPVDGKAVTAWGNRDAALVNVALGVRAALAGLTKITPSTETEEMRSSNPVTRSPELTVGLANKGEGLDNFDFVLRNTGSRTFAQVRIALSIPEQEGESIDIFESVGGGEVGTLDPNFAIHLPAPSRVIHHLLSRVAVISNGERNFLNQLQLTIEGLTAPDQKAHYWVYRFQFIPLKDGTWACELAFKAHTPSLDRLIIKPKRPAAFGGEFFAEPKYRCE